MSPPATQLRYMTRFRCIAERCEDTCCAGLRVPVSEPQWKRMQAAVKGDPEESRRLHACVSPNPGGGKAEHAVIQMRPDGLCPLLDTERLCSLQRRHGETMLPDICATFPRVVTARGDQVELTGTLACPEVARLCLLSEDAVEAVPLSTEELARTARPELTRHLPPDTVDAARPALLGLLNRREYPLSSRLVLLGHLSHSLDELDADNTHSRNEVMRSFQSSEVLDALHQEFQTLALPGGPTVGLFRSLLEARMSAGRGERFDTLMRGVWASLSLEEGSPEALDAAWRTYVERWRRLEEAQGERLHQYFHNYAVHSLWRTPFTDTPTLLASVFRLVLRVALLRLTLMGHPRVAALQAESASGAEAQERLDQAAVETFQLLAKNVEQSPDFLARAQGLVGTGREAAALGKVLIFATF